MTFFHLPAVLIKGDQALILSDDGEFVSCTFKEAAETLSKTPHVLCYKTFYCMRLKRSLLALDVLELIAFVYPTRFCVPTLEGVLHAFGYTDEMDAAGQLQALLGVVNQLVAMIIKDDHLILYVMAMTDWAWRPIILGEWEAFSGETLEGWRDRISHHVFLESLDSLPLEEARKVKAQEEEDKYPQHEDLIKIMPDALHCLLDGLHARPSQEAYSKFLLSFLGEEKRDDTVMMMAQAGTGAGKTVGYLAPFSSYVALAPVSITVSTYTKHLQYQVYETAKRVIPFIEKHKPQEKHQYRSSLMMQKGRENYLCLLKYRDMVLRTPVLGEQSVGIMIGGMARGDDGAFLSDYSMAQGISPLSPSLLGMMSRWIAVTQDGDLSSVLFPHFLFESERSLKSLTDHNDECLHAQCPYYKKCFIEKSNKADQALIKVSNHAKVLSSYRFSQGYERRSPQYIIFDEGHHLFQSADQAFSFYLSKFNMMRFKKKLLGPIDKKNSYSLAVRLKFLDEDYPEYLEALSIILDMCSHFPSFHHHGLSYNTIADRFLGAVRDYLEGCPEIYDRWHTIEMDLLQVPPELKIAAEELYHVFEVGLKGLSELQDILEGYIQAKQQDDGAQDDIAQARRMFYKLDKQMHELFMWCGMLACVGDQKDEGQFCDWFELTRKEGKEVDVGIKRHWINPMIPFRDYVMKDYDGIVVTSATLTDKADKGCGDFAEQSDNLDILWSMAEKKSGACYLDPSSVKRINIASPFDYATQTRVFIVSDINVQDDASIADAYKKLFAASQGGGLGIFTSIRCLKYVYHQIMGEMNTLDIPLYGQHCEGIHLSSLVDMFRFNDRACLLGTDAVRDGLDVPGGALRMVVFDRVPWPRLTHLHKMRRTYFGGRSYDDVLIRERMRQAYGRIVRSDHDHGVFVMLDRRFSSKLYDAFPEGVSIVRGPLDEIISRIKDFFETWDHHFK